MTAAVSGAALLGYGRIVSSLGNTGANIGDMTANGGLAAAFDGTTAQVATSCARKTAVTSAYVGKNYSGGTPASYAIDHAVAYTSTDLGLSANGAVSCTIKLWAKQSLPANSSDGTLLGSNTFTDSNSQQVLTITSSDKGTRWAYVWIECLPGGSTPNANIAELQIFGIQ